MRSGAAIWQALERARRANLVEAGLPAPVSGSTAPTRRAVIKALAAIGAGGWAVPAETRRRHPLKVAIIGGGLAGLSTLHHLVKGGSDATVYEARPRLGGRMHTVRTNGTLFERGGQLVNRDHADLKALARAYRVTLIDRKIAPFETPVLLDGRAIDPVHLADGLRGIAGAIDADAKRLDADFAAVARELDPLSIAAYLDRHAALLPHSWVRHVLEATSRTEYGVEPGEASALELLFNLPVVDGARVELLGNSDESHVIAGGSSALIAAMRARHAARIKTGRTATRIAAVPGGRVVVTFADGQQVVVDRVVVAIPAPLVRRLAIDVPLPLPWRAFIAEMGLGRNEKVQWAMVATPWRSTIGAGGEAWSAERDPPAGLAWEGSVRGGGPTPPVWTWFLGGKQVDRIPGDSALAATFASVAPGIAAARAKLPPAPTAWHRDPLTRGAYSNFRPGQLTRFASLLWVEDEPAPQTGPVVFVGEHLSDAFPGYMNGAAQTGRMAAAAILRTGIARVAA